MRPDNASSAAGWLARLALLGLMLSVGCSSTAPQPPRASAAAAPVVYEGLPHFNGEPKSYEVEKHGAKPLTERAGYDFYAEPLTIQAADLKTLTRLIDDPATLEAWAGEKKCGGFHPDYAVEWQQGAGTRAVLLCFTCGEAKVIGPGAVQQFDLSQSSKKTLVDLFKPYRRNRPKPLPHEGAG